MKFLCKWMEVEKYHPEWGNSNIKEHTWYALTDKWILAQNLQITRIQFTDHMKFNKKEDQSVGASVLLRSWTKYTQEQIGRWSVEQRLKKRPPRDCPTWVFIPYTVANPDTIVNAKKCMLKGAWYGCPLRSPVRVLQIQRQMLTANHWTEHEVRNRGVRERTEGVEGLCNPIGITTISTNPPQRSQTLKH